MAVTLGQIREKFPNLLTWLRGDLTHEVLGIETPERASAQHLAFIADAKHLKKASGGGAKAWVVHPSLVEQVPGDIHVFATPQVTLAMALVSREFFPIPWLKRPHDGEAIHPSAVISPSAKLGNDVIIGPNTTIASGVEIGDAVVIGANTTIEANVKVGARSHIHSQVYVAHGCVLGEDCEIHPQTSIGTEGFGYAHDAKSVAHRQPHYGRVVFEERVHIGAGVQIDRGTFADSRIGAGTIIDNHCHFGHNIQIGRGCIITGGMITAGSVTIGDRCVFGGRTTIAGHITIASGCQFAGLSAIHSSVTEPGQYGGYPIQPLKDHLKTTASFPALPRMRKQLATILKHLGLETGRES